MIAATHAASRSVEIWGDRATHPSQYPTAVSPDQARKVGPDNSVTGIRHPPRPKCERSSTPRSWPGWLLVAALLAILVAGSMPTGTLAHAALDTSTPVAGEVLAAAPDSVSLTFTEPLEQSYSRLQIFDSQGVEVPGTTLSFGDDGYSMSLALPGGMANGTYSVLWRTLSEADGHTAQNYITFTVGTNADIAPVVIPGTSSGTDDVPQWAKTASRWAALIGAALLMAAWPIWSTVVRPALNGTRPLAIVRRMRRYILWAAVLALLGSVFALVVQAWSLPDGTWLDKIINTLGQTRYGKLWLLRAGLLFGLALVLPACGWWFMRRRQLEGLIAWVLSIGVAIPFSLIAHASAQPAGRTFAVVADAIHLLASAAWFGGITLLLIVVLPGLRGLDDADRRQVLRSLLPRFSIMALCAMAIIGVTGFYAGWLQVGNLAALTGTSYGRALIVKLVVLLGILLLAAFNLFVIERRIERQTVGEVGSVWTPRLRWTVAGEFLLALVLLGAVGQMTSLQPARDVMTEQGRQIAITFPDAEPASTLLLAPGIAGVNHFRLEIDGPTLPADTAVLLRLTMPDNKDLGTREIQLSRVAGNAFEHHGSELGITGDWAFTVIIREPGAAQINLDTTQEIGSTPPEVDVPAAPWRFRTLGGVTGLVMILAGIVGLVVGWRVGPGTTRKESAGLGAAALLLGVILLFQAKLDPILAEAGPNAVLDTANVAMVERGEAIYVAQCLSCHGTDLRGDGPAGEGMDPPPADFSAPHTMVHSVDDLIYWVRNGKQGTDMPGFGNVLSDQEIRDVLTYIAAEQQSMAASAANIAPDACTTTPLTIAGIEGLVGTTQTAQNPEVGSSAPDGPTIDAITATSEQLLACTNAMDTLARLGLFSPNYLATEFGAGLPAGFAEAASTEPTPLPEESWLTLDSIENVQLLADGRVSAMVIVNDPSGQLGGEATQSAHLVFVQQDGQWLIDEMMLASQD